MRHPLANLLAALALALAACKPTSFSSGGTSGSPAPRTPAPTPGGDVQGQPSGTTGRPTDDDETVPGYLLNVEKIAITRGNGEAKLVAPPGTLVIKKGSGLITVWELADNDPRKFTKYVGKDAYVYGTLLAKAMAEPDGSFTVNYAATPGKRQALSTEPDSNGGAFIVHGRDVTTAATLDETGVKRFGYADVAPDAEGSSTAEPASGGGGD